MLICTPARAVDDIHIVIAVKDSNGLCKRARQVFIVGIEIAEIAPGGRRQPLVEPIGRALVRLQDQGLDTIRITRNDLAAAIRRTRIDHDIFDIDALLPDHRQDRPLKELGLVEGYGDDGKGGHQIQPLNRTKNKTNMVRRRHRGHIK